MKHFAVFSLLSIGLISSLVSAQESSNQVQFKVLTTHAVVDRDTLLKVSVEELAPQSGVCPYYAKGFIFDANTKNLKVDMTKGFCPNEQYGKSAGKFYWMVPSALVRSHDKICVSVNGGRADSVSFEGLGKGLKLVERGSCK